MTIKEFEKRVKINGGYDREIDEWKIIDIHTIPDLFLAQSEVDFYCCNGKTVYLLRLRNSEKEKYTTTNSNPVYLIAELPLSEIDNDFIKTVLSKFKL